MSPDESALRAHLKTARFVSAVKGNKWRIVDDPNWPILIIAISADIRPNSPAEFFFRFDLQDYPTAAPTAILWDPINQCELPDNHRPKGTRAHNIFRTVWQDAHCLYAPFDRLAIERHKDWQKTHPEYLWNNNRTLSWLLNHLHQILNNDDYTGI